MWRLFWGCVAALFLVMEGQAAEKPYPDVAAERSLALNATGSHNATLLDARGVYQLQSVDVIGERAQIGMSTISGRELHSLPSHSGSMTEALKGASNVQFSNGDTSSLTGGEIRPPRVSIAGGKPYENNFLVDGMSVSNTLNPSGLDGDGGSATQYDLAVNGADQTIFYDVSLLESVTVHSSNVPAKYGNFVGGVVNARLADPRTDRWHGVLMGKYAHSDWFDLRGPDEDSETPARQPRFQVETLHAAADGPLGENAALLVAASRKHSTIPLVLEEIDGTLRDKDQYRSSENFFARVLLAPRPDLTWTVDATYAPYVEERWKESYAGSKWRIENEAWRLASTAELSRNWGTLTGRFGYSTNGFSRDAANSLRRLYVVNGTQTVRQGGVGDAVVSSKRLDAGLEIELAEYDSGPLAWRVSSGLDLDQTFIDMWNESARVETLTVFKNGNRTTIETDYLENDQTRIMSTAGWFAQTEMVWGRFSLTPGLRLDYDDYSSNLDLSPRLKAEFDTMGDGVLRLVAGANRYHGGQLRAYAFDRHRPSYTRLESYIAAKNSTTVKHSVGYDKSYLAQGLDTPYSDELMAGVLGEVWGFEYGLELVHRDHRDQIMSVTRKDVLAYNANGTIKTVDSNYACVMTNDGKSEYDGVTLTLGRAFETTRLGIHRFDLGITKARIKTFSGAFNSELETLVKEKTSFFENDYTRVYYNGEVINRGDMPADDFNAPLVVTLNWLGSFLDDRLRVNCVSRWRDSATGLVPDSRVTSETPFGTTSGSATVASSQWLNAEGNYHDAYRKGTISGGLISDASLEYDAVRTERLTLSLLLDVTNVFGSDAESHVSVVEGNVVRGRGYYAGLRCEF